MNNNNTFKMTYSAKQQKEIEAIREKYIPKEENKIEKLKALDSSAEKKSTMISVIIGTVGTLIMGIGMSILMSDFGNIFGSYKFLCGIIIGILGITLLALAYPIYNIKLKKERKKIAPEIIKLTDELMK